MSDINTIRTLLTVLAFSLFMIVAIWAWWPSRKSSLDRLALTPLQDDHDLNALQTASDDSVRGSK